MAVVVVVASIAGVGVVSANERPLAAAGLDQEVPEGSTVYLDGGGSLDPDGSIEEYRWTIRTPNGTTIQPDCPSCVQTAFLADQDGTYNVTLTVTDDDGATRSDTMYVTATVVESPSVTVSGPATVENSKSASFEASATAGSNELTTLVWLSNGTEIEQKDVSSETADDTLRLDFRTEGRTEIQARIIDEIGSTGTDSHRVEVTPNQSDDVSTNTGGPDGYTSMLSRTDDSYEILIPRGEVSGRGSGTMLDENEINALQELTGVKMSSVATNTGLTDALSITNQQLKDDIDKEAGRRGAGFLDSISEYINPESRSYEVDTKIQYQSPGTNWERVGRVVTDTETTDSKVHKPNYELVEVIENPGSQTYRAPLPRNHSDEQIGVYRQYNTRWQDTRPADGDYEETRRNIDHYTWTETETRTERVKIGTEVVGEVPEYGWKEVERTETKHVCVERTTIYGNSICTRTKPHQIRTTEEVWGIVGSKEITQPVYDTHTYTEEVTKTGKNPPIGATDITAHYTTEYKIKEVTSSTPVWRPVSTKYRYEIYEYRWERTDI
ncbi:PKD domain-containing protein [Salinibaculum salinum]|uniref:PKD domain-containing protein n=1 Tax=Salinibaculum salinum TaxID=3131996 RepID=UPI0030EEE15B